MPRDLPLGNGVMEVNFDLRHCLIDLFYPDVGGENHVLGHPFRLGVWTEGGFAWIGDDGWRRIHRYLPETLVTDVTLEHPALGVRLALQECVDFNVNAFVRRIAVANLADTAYVAEHPLLAVRIAGGSRGTGAGTSPATREIRVFFHHDFHISGSDIGDTAYYDPNSRGLFHYKGRRWFHANIQTPQGVGWAQYAIGIKEWENREGTWRDAEDGVLGMNPIAQGAVDSTGGISLTIPAGGEQAAYYWLLAGESYEELRGLNRFIQRRGPETFLRRTRDYWYLWVNKEAMDFGPLPPEIVACFKQSILIARTQIDSKGAIIASTDSDLLHFGRDTYNYVWPRDGALAAHALDLAGYDDVPRRFYQFCGDVMTREGFLLHKYNPDKSVGSSWHPWVADGARQYPIQEDETALVVWALWLHFAMQRDVEFIKPLYRPLIIKAAEFLVGFRDPETGLPRPSYDLWEERHGVHAFTCGTVYGGLVGAAALAEAFGETDRAARYKTAADELRTGVLRYLWSAEAGRFGRTLTSGAPEGARLDLTIDASLYGLFAFGMLAPDDPKVMSTMQAVETRLWVQTQVGGIARYENDNYQRVSTGTTPVPGNPWILCTLWLAEWYIARARSQDDLARPRDLLRWAAAKALPSGVLPEQVHPITGEPLSVSPLTWSHAEFVQATVQYLDRVHSLDLCPACGRPRYRRQESHLIRPFAAALGVPGDPPAPANQA